MMVCAALLGGIALPASAQQLSAAPIVLAAASLQEALTDAGNAWAAKRRLRPVLSFAGSAALARQIEAGAPADLFIAADEEWMDYVASKALIRPSTRAVLVSNRLVLIAPAGRPVRLVIGRNFPIVQALGQGRLAMADPDSVPAGRYAKSALGALNVWTDVEPNIARAENVRAALALVERREAPLGIVYATDARASTKVQIVGAFPTALHPPITYPVAVLRRSINPEAEAFRRFLLSREGKAIFARRGFIVR